MTKFTLSEDEKVQMREIAEKYLQEYTKNQSSNGRLALLAKMLDVRPDIQIEARTLGNSAKQAWLDEKHVFGHSEGPDPYADGYASIIPEVEGLRELWLEYQERNNEVVSEFERRVKPLGGATLPTEMPKIR